MNFKSGSVRLLALLGLSLLLTSCISFTGKVEISSAGLATGDLIYTIDKQLAAAAGLTSIEQIRAEFKKNSSGPDNYCEDVAVKDESTSYVFTCDLKNSKLSSEDLSVEIQNESITFVFKQNTDQEDSDNTFEFGTVELQVTFPGKILEIVENKPGLVSKLSDRNVRISGSGSGVFNIKITSACDLKCGASISEVASTFKIAPKNFTGIISENLKFTRSNSPYTVTRTIQIPKGKAVYVEPGVTFNSKFNKKLQFNDAATFHVRGQIFLDGTKSSPINLNGKPNIHILTALADSDTKIYLNHVNIIGGQYLFSGGGSFNLKMHESIISGIKYGSEISYPHGKNEISRNRFVKSGGFRIGFHGENGLNSFIIKDNIFEGRPITGEDNNTCWIENWAAYTSALVVTENDFSKASKHALCVIYQSGVIDARGNFWGTAQQEKIGKLVLDAADSIKYPMIIDTSGALNSPTAVTLDIRKLRR